MYLKIVINIKGSFFILIWYSVYERLSVKIKMENHKKRESRLDSRD